MNRADYFIQRVGSALFTTFVAVSLNFVLFRVLPGSAAQNLSQVPGGGAALQAALNREFGLDKSLLEQYRLYLWNLLHLDFGVSFANQQPVLSNLQTAFFNTLPLVLAGSLVAIVAGMIAGVLAAWRRGTVVEHLSVVPALGFYALPVQWLGMVLILLCGGFLPTSGRIDEYLIDPTSTEHFFDVLQHMVLPSATLALVLYGQYTLIMRSSMLETLGEDYVLTGKAVGFPTRWVLRKFAFRNAMLPVISVVALSAGFIVGGAILTETVFNWPGLGFAVYQAVLQRDYPMLQGAFLFLTVSVILCNLIADLIYFKLDPRISQS